MATAPFGGLGAAARHSLPSKKRRYRRDRQERTAILPVAPISIARLEALHCEELRERVQQPVGCIGQLAAESSRAAQLKRIRVSVEYPMRTSAVKLVVRRVVVLCGTYLLYA